MSDELLWNAMLKNAAGKTAKVNQLLEYVDVYSDPSRIVEAYSDEETIEKVRE